MQLAFIDSRGEVVELSAALETDALLVQGLLSTALFEGVRSRLPDTIDILIAERSIRDALSVFSGETERRVSTYILTRVLDPRIIAPRTQLIHQSFEVGGPIALAGVFYATIDSHRNLRNREILNFLIRLDEPNRLNLFRRASSFPCHPSMGPWLARLFGKLDPDTRDLARLLLCLGKSTIPSILFDRARLPSRTWGENGEIVDIPNSVLLLLQSQQRFLKAVQELADIRFASLGGGGILVASSSLDLLEDWDRSVQWRQEAVRLVSHGFPKHQVHHGKEYADLCLTLMPILRHVVTYLPNMPLSQDTMYQAAEACLSASSFLIQEEDFIGAAQYLAERSDSPIIAARVALRKRAIERVHGSRKTLPSPVLFPQGDRRSQAFAVGAVCLQAQHCIDLGLLASAHNELSRCSIEKLDSCSPLERVQQEEARYIRAKVYRLEGQFAAARTLLADLVDNHSHIAERAIIHLSAVECELGHVTRAIASLETRLQQNDFYLVARSRFELALANAQLMQMLLQVRDQRLSWCSNPFLRDTYLRCLGDLSAHTSEISTLYTRIGIVAALAILAHLCGDFDTALAKWNQTVELAQGQGLVGSYIDLVAAYSINDALLRRGGPGTTDLEDKVRGLWPRTGRQYHFLGLGTTWPDILGDWQEDRGRDRLTSTPALPLT